MNATEWRIFISSTLATAEDVLCSSRADRRALRHPSEDHGVG